jgi:hypothetical protein
MNKRYRNNWLQYEGIPRALYQDDGTGWMRVGKNIRRDLEGRPEMLYPVDTSMPGAGGVTVSASTISASAVGFDQFNVDVLSQFYQTMQVDWNAIRLSTGNRNNYPRGRAMDLQMLGHAKRWHHLASSWLWGDGGAALAQIDPAQVLTAGVTTTLQLTCPRTAIRFEHATTDSNGVIQGGDVVEFSVDAGTPGLALAGTKTFTARIVKLDWDAGTITLDTAVTNEIAAGDFIFVNGTYGQLFRGFFAWCPTDATTLVNTFFGVDRSSAPQKLGGTRVKINKGQDPYTILTKICERASINNAKYTIMFTTPEEMTRIKNAYRDKGTTVVLSGDMARMTQNVMAFRVENPAGNGHVDLVADKYLADIDAPRDEQQLYCAFDESAFEFHTAFDAISWANFDGNGPVYQVQGTSILQATHGCLGQYATTNPRNMLVASPNVVLE